MPPPSRFVTAIAMRLESHDLPRRNKLNIRDAAKFLALNLGYDIRQTGSHFYKRPIDFLRSRNIDLVIDVGANVGQYAERLRKDAYTGWIVSFEPTAAAYEELAALANKDGRWKAINIALGDMRDLPRSMSVSRRYSARFYRNSRRLRHSPRRLG
jgi:hypothetical protein